MFKVPEKYRLKSAGHWGSDSSFGNNGAFQIKSLKLDVVLYAIASDGGDWEHVSVSVMGRGRNPTWTEMCFIKSLFWDDQDTVIQYHPAQENYINFYPTCLHLWRPVGVDLPLPPSEYVGPKQ